MAGPLERVFAQYDRIRSHSRVPAPTPLAPDPQADAGPADLPPWWSPDVDPNGPNQPPPAVAPAPPVPQAEAPLPPEGPSRAEELGAGLLGAAHAASRGTGFARAAAADEAAALGRINQYASPLLQRLSPEFAQAAEADGAAALSRIGQYATPALRASGGFGASAMGLTPIVGGLAAGAAYDALYRYAEAKGREYGKPIQPGEVSFSVDGGAPLDPYRKKKASRASMM